jgi:hypothetical protein
MRGNPSDLFVDLRRLQRVGFCNALISRGRLRSAPFIAALLADQLPGPFVHRLLHVEGLSRIQCSRKCKGTAAASPGGAPTP